MSTLKGVSLDIMNGPGPESQTNPVEQKRLRRKKAMHWWFSVRAQQKVILTTEYYPKKRYYMLSGSEIEAIWLIEDPETSKLWQKTG